MMLNKLTTDFSKESADTFKERPAELFKNVNLLLDNLHDFSKQDFVTLSAQLKSYQTQIKAISEHASSIAIIAQNKKEDDLGNLLRDVFEKLKTQISHYTDNINQDVNDLEGVIAQLDDLLIPLNQLKAYLSKVGKENKQIDEERVVDGLLNYVNSFNETIENRSNRLNGVLSQLREKQVYESNNIIKVFHEGMEQYQTALAEITDLAWKIQNCFQSISNITTDLQYHDIIRQKLEHIGAIHAKLIHDFETSSDVDTLDYRRVMPEIAALHMKLLEFSSEEYREATQNIRKHLHIIGKDTHSIAAACINFLEYVRKTERHFLEELSQRLQVSLESLGKLSVLNHDFSLEIRKIYRNLYQLSKYIEVANNIDSQLEAINDEVKPQLESKQSEEEITDVTKKLSLLTLDFQRLTDKMQSLIEDTLETESHLKKEILKNKNKRNKAVQIFDEESYSRLMEAFNELHQNNHRIYHILLQTNDLSKQTSSDIKDAADKIKHAELFDELVNNINGKLSFVLEQTEADTDDMQRSELSAELLDIQTYYSMHSERQIFQELFLLENDNIQEEDVRDSDEDDIEFF